MVLSLLLELFFNSSSRARIRSRTVRLSSLVEWVKLIFLFVQLVVVHRCWSLSIGSGLMAPPLALPPKSKQPATRDSVG
jgi:hypothetical protein